MTVADEGVKRGRYRTFGIVDHSTVRLCTDIRMPLFLAHASRPKTAQWVLAGHMPAAEHDRQPCSGTVDREAAPTWL